jgi:hypothetical protein
MLGRRHVVEVEQDANEAVGNGILNVGRESDV